MKYKLLLVFLLCLASGCSKNPNFEGHYQCKGFDPYLNRYYSGTIDIIKQNAVYALKMDYDTGERYKGTAGLYDNSSISVVFQDLSNLKIVGLEKYSYSKDRKSIEGYWVYLGQDKLGKEVCSKVD